MYIYIREISNPNNEGINVAFSCHNLRDCVYNFVFELLFI